MRGPAVGAHLLDEQVLARGGDLVGGGQLAANVVVAARQPGDDERDAGTDDEDASGGADDLEHATARHRRYPL